jgi:outer membrane biosynthesis protein TonB
VPEKKKPKPKPEPEPEPEPEPDKDKKYTWSMHPGPDGKITVSCHSAQVGGQSPYLAYSCRKICWIKA